jgi:hypothetical protein
MKLYVNRAGMKEAVVKFGKIVLWVAVSGAVTALVDYFGSMQVDPQNYVLVAIVGLVNALLAGLARWLTTKQ